MLNKVKPYCVVCRWILSCCSGHYSPDSKWPLKLSKLSIQCVLRQSGTEIPRLQSSRLSVQVSGTVSSMDLGELIFIRSLDRPTDNSKEPHLLSAFKSSKIAIHRFVLMVPKPKKEEKHLFHRYSPHLHTSQLFRSKYCCTRSSSLGSKSRCTTLYNIQH